MWKPCRRELLHAYCRLLRRSLMKKAWDDLPIISIFAANWSHRCSIDLQTNEHGPGHRPSMAIAAGFLAPISFGGRSLNASSTKNATSPAQPNERLQPAPPWPYECTIRLGVARESAVLNSRSTRTFRALKGRNPCANGYSGSRLALRSAGRNASHRARIR